jgi:hypothetical protein
MTRQEAAHRLIQILGSTEVGDLIEDLRWPAARSLYAGLIGRLLRARDGLER